MTWLSLEARKFLSSRNGAGRMQTAGFSPLVAGSFMGPITSGHYLTDLTASSVAALGTKEDSWLRL